MKHAEIRATVASEGAWGDTLLLRDAGSVDTWTGASALTASYQLRFGLTPGADTLDADDAVSGEAADTVTWIVDDWTDLVGDTRARVYGWLYWTPATGPYAGKQQAIAHYILDVEPG